LDEATSALDTQSEQKIQEAIEKVAKDRIVFVIAHRMSTIEHADTILVLRHGSVVGQGKHDELSNHSAEYQKLIQKRV
jgi:subfamily B ATP-binding cassette protein MsbA